MSTTGPSERKLVTIAVIAASGDGGGAFSAAGKAEYDARMAEAPRGSGAA